MMEADVMQRRRQNPGASPALLGTPRRLIEEMPKGERQQSLRAQLEELEKSTANMGAATFFSAMMNGISRIWKMNRPVAAS